MTCAREYFRLSGQAILQVLQASSRAFFSDPFQIGKMPCSLSNVILSGFSPGLRAFPVSGASYRDAFLRCAARVRPSLPLMCSMPNFKMHRRFQNFSISA